MATNDSYSLTPLTALVNVKGISNTCMHRTRGIEPQSRRGVEGGGAAATRQLLSAGVYEALSLHFPRFRRGELDEFSWL